MNILVVSSKYEPEYSGSGYRAQNTYCRFRKKFNIQFNVVTNSVNYSDDRFYKVDGSDVFRIGRRYNFQDKIIVIRKFFVLLNLVREFYKSYLYIRKNINNYDLVHTFGDSWSVSFYTLYFAFHKKPIIRELCNDMSNPLYDKRFHYFMNKIFKSNNSLVVAISERLLRVSKKYNIKNIWCRPNPIDEIKFIPQPNNKSSLRRKLTKFDKNDIVLSLIANFIDRKNQMFALEVLSLLPHNFKLVLAGPLKKEGTTYFNKLKSSVQKLGLDSRVDLQPGFVYNFQEFLTLSDVFLFPSKAEGLGTPLLEAQACAIPVISNDIKGISDSTIEFGVGGFFLELDPYDWSEMIKRSLNITADTLLNNSKYIHSVASSTVIDQEYFNKIARLISNSEN